MSNPIRIRRRTSGATGSPSSLLNAELAFNEVDNTLYYGYGDVAGAASSILAIGGPGAFATLTSCQTISGDKTFTGSLNAVTQANATNSNLVATTAFVTNKLANLTNVVNGFNNRTGNVTLTSNDVTTALGYTPLTPLANITHANGTIIYTTNRIRGEVQVYTEGLFTKKQYSGFYSTANGAEPTSYRVGLACLTTSTGGLTSEHFLDISGDAGFILQSGNQETTSSTAVRGDATSAVMDFYPGDSHLFQRGQLYMFSEAGGGLLTGNSTYVDLFSEMDLDRVGVRFSNNGTHALASLIAPSSCLTLLYDANSILSQGYADSRYISTPASAAANQVLTYNGTSWLAANHTNCLTTTNGNLSFTVNSDGFGFNKIMANASEYVFPWLKLNDNYFPNDGKRNMQLVWKHYPTPAGYTATGLILGDTYARISATTGAGVGPDPESPNANFPYGLGVHDYTHPYDITTKYWADLTYARANSPTVSGNLAVSGDATITGNLTVNGNTTTLNSVTLTIDDKNIELGSVASPTNVTADGGGLTLRGATDKSLIWYNATNAWTSSENLSLVTGKTYQINAVTVLSSTTLGSTVVNSSLTSVGTISTGVWQGSTIGVAYGGTGATTLTGYVKGSGTSALTACATIPGADISGNITGNAAGLTGTLTVGFGGTGVTTLTSGSYLKGNGTGAITTSSTIPVGDLSGTLSVAGGGTGAVTLTGYVKGSGTSALTASSTIPGSDISGNITGNATNVTGIVAVVNGGTGAANATAARTNLLAAASGSNTDITSLGGLTTALSVSQGGTGVNTLLLNGYIRGNGTSGVTACTTIPGTAISGNITGNAAGLTGTLTVAFGGTGVATLTSGSYLKGNGTGAITTSATIPGSDISGNITGAAGNVTGIVAVVNGGTGVATITGLIKGNGTSAFVAATAGTDYLSPSSTIDGGTF